MAKMKRTKKKTAKLADTNTRRKPAKTKAAQKAASKKFARKKAVRKKAVRKKATGKKKAASKKGMSKRPAVKKAPARELAPPKPPMPSPVTFGLTRADPAKEGDRIESLSNKKHGTLTTKIMLQNPTRRGWLMSAHVAAESMNPNSSPVAITLPNGTRIGQVTEKNFHREKRYDVAFITPDRPLSGRTSFRGVASITQADVGREVFMVGAVTPDFRGEITDANCNEPIGDEIVENHIGIKVTNGLPAQDGDSGALVIMADDNKVAGIMRASNKVNFAVATKFSVASRDLKFVLAD